MIFIILFIIKKIMCFQIGSCVQVNGSGLSTRGLCGERTEKVGESVW